MIPSHFMVLDALPLTLSGKVDRKALPAPDLARGEGGYVAPRNPTEQAVAAIWSEVLRLDKVGVSDNFFALGGHSLLATQVLAKVRAHFAIQLPLRALFEAPNVAELSQRVAEVLREPDRPMAPRIVPVPRDRALPLSFAQKRFWFLDQFQPGAASYNAPLALTLTGRLDVALLSRVFSALIARHEPLRTTFGHRDGVPEQIIAPAEPIVLAVEDFTALAPDDAGSAIEQRIRGEATTVFDLESGPLIRVRLLKRGSDEHVLLLTLHHILYDGWSMPILTSDLLRLYDAFAADRPSPLENLPIQYADYCHWEQEQLTGPVLDQQLGYWRRYLADASDLLQLPTDRKRPAVATFAGATHDAALSPALTGRLIALAQRHNATLFMVVAAVFKTLFHRLSGQRDICLVNQTANRPAGTEALIGIFANLTTLRSTDHRRDDVRRRAACHRGAGPVGRRVSDSVPARADPHRRESRCVVHAVRAGGAEFPQRDRSRRPLRGPSGTARACARGAWRQRHHPRRFRAEGRAAPGTGPPVDRLRLQHRPVRPGDHRALAPLPRTRGGTRLRRDRNACARFSAARRGGTAATHRRLECDGHGLPEAALPARAVCRTGGPHARCGRGRLRRSAAQLCRTGASREPAAHRLIRLGVGPETAVGLCMARSIELVIGVLGIMKAGGIYVPLDPSYPPERLAFMLEDAQAAVLLTTAAQSERLPTHWAHEIRLDDDWPDIAGEPEQAPAGGALAENLAYVIYTSGSTGKPKGVGVAHYSAINFILACSSLAPQSPGVAHSWWTSMGFDLSIQRYSRRSSRAAGWNSCPTRCAAISAGSSTGFAPAASSAPTCQVPAWRCWRRPWRPGGRMGDPPPGCRRRADSGRGAVQPAQRGRWASRHQRLRPDRDHGVLDALPAAAGGLRRHHDDRFTDLEHADLRARRPAGTGADRRHRRAVHRRRWRCARLSRPAWSDRGKIRAKPVRQWGAALPTGDLARWRADGNIDFLGRIDHQVKLRGFRIELGEIEAALATAPGVREAIVMVREDQPGDRRLVAYIARQDGAEAPEDATLRTVLGRSLPDYMIPSHFVVLDALPMTTNGKVDRRALPAPDLTRGEADYVAPRNATEEIVAGIWSEVLGFARIGIYDDFFALGGHSLVATQVVTRLREAFGTEFPLRALFEAPRLDALSAAVDEARRQGLGLAVPPLTAQPRPAQLPLSYAQERLWLLEQIESLGAAYNVPAAVRLTGALDDAALEFAFGEIVRRHEALRTRFAITGDNAEQVIDPPGGFRLERLDLSTHEMSGREDELSRVIRACAERPFDLARGELFRAVLLRLAPDKHVVVVVMHHIVADGWSLGVLIPEVGALYRAFVEGRPSPLPELPVQYADFALWQRAWLQGAALEQQVGYWKARLAGAPAVLDLPTDRPRKSAQRYQGASVSVALPKLLMDGLDALARREGASLFMVLLAAFQLLLSRWSGQQDIVVETPVAARTDRRTKG